MRKLLLLLLAVGSKLVAGEVPLPPPPPPPMEIPQPTSTPAPTAAAALPNDLPLPPPPPLPVPTVTNANNLKNDPLDNLLPPLPTAIPLPSANAAANNNSTIPPPPSVNVPAIPEATTPFTVVSGATSGVITGGRVNIRAGDSTKYEIVHTADQDTPVSVFEKKGEWVQIGFPEKEFCYVDQRALDGEVPADIPEQGIVRAVRNNQTKIYVRPWPNSTVVGELNQGENVVVTGARGQYLRIRPPHSARAWVFDKFVRYSGGDVPSVELTAEEKAAREKETELRNAAAEAKKMKKDENNPLLVKLRERNNAARAQRDQQREAAKTLVANLDQQLAAIDAETAARVENAYRSQNYDKQAEAARMQVIEENYRPGPPPGSLGNSATGWVEHVAFWRNRPAEYRLVKGQEIICYLRSLRYNLADYNGRQVVVSGNVVKAPNSRTDVLVVDNLRLFDHLNSEPTLDNNRDNNNRRGFSLRENNYEAVEVVREPTTFAPLPHRVTTPRETFEPPTVIDRRYSPDDYYGERQLRVGERIDVTGMRE